MKIMLQSKEDSNYHSAILARWILWRLEHWRAHYLWRLTMMMMALLVWSVASSFSMQLDILNV